MLAGIVTLTLLLCSRLELKADRNYAALMEESADEKDRPKGRYRTVACGGPGFHDWKTYCCQENQYWDNCPDLGTCKSTEINGCK